MIVTSGSISKLKAGANVASLDVTAVDDDGKHLFAGLVQCEDDAKLRKNMDIPEFQPTVQVVSRTWYGSYGRFPNIKFEVSDGSGENMNMRVSYRRPEFPARFFAKNGPFNGGRLNAGNKIKLLDYTCGLEHEKGGTTCPTIYVEKLRSEPKKVLVKHSRTT
jgi:hypothetical protein